MAIVPVDNTFGLRGLGRDPSCRGLVSSISGSATVSWPSQGGPLPRASRRLSCCVSRYPTALGFDDAATIPIVYTTAAYSLFDIGGLRKGQVRTSCPSPPKCLGLTE